MSVVSKVFRKVGRVLSSAASNFGIEVQASSVNNRPDMRFAKMLNDNHCTVLLDVGANVGYYARELFKAGYLGKIVSFEPIPENHATLTRRAKAYSARWIIAPRMALSDVQGEAQFNVSAANASSSLLNPTEEFSRFGPGVRVAQVIKVDTVRLDDIIDQYTKPDDIVFLKMDVQGAEHLVLKGAEQTVRRCLGIHLEVCLSPLYEGQAHLDDVMQYLKEQALGIWDIEGAYREPNGKLAAIDITAVRRKK